MIGYKNVQKIINASTVTNHCLERLTVSLFLYYQDYVKLTKEQQNYYKQKQSNF